MLNFEDNNSARSLSLDLGTKCGWAITPEESGVWDLTPRRFEGAGFRFIRFRKHLQDVFQIGIRIVFFEEVRHHKGVDAAHCYGGLLAVLQEECELRKIPFTGIPVGTIKAKATGKGNSNKEQMIEAAKNKWGTQVRIIDDNHADALWISECGKEFEMETGGSQI